MILYWDNNFLDQISQESCQNFYEKSFFQILTFYHENLTIHDFNLNGETHFMLHVELS